MSMSGSTVTDRAAWLAERQSGVGASEAAAALGLSPFESPRELYLRKVGILPPIEETDAMRQGTFFEPYIAAEYERKTGRKVVDQQIFIKSPITPLMATLDGITDAGFPVEFKFVTGPARNDLGDEDSDNIPDHWMIQSHQQMFLSGTYEMDFAVQPAGRPLRVYHVSRDEDLVEQIVRGVRAFWGHVERRQSPPSNDRADLRTLHLLYSGCEGEIELGAEELCLVEDLAELAATYKEIDEEKAKVKTRLLERLGNHAVGILPDGRQITRRIVTVGPKTIVRTGYMFTDLRISKGTR